jgi:integrase
MSTPTRRRVEQGIYERLDAAGERRGLEIAYKDADGRARRRAVKGDIHDARDALAAARTRRARHELEPANPRTTFASVCDAFEAAQVTGLRPNSQTVYLAALRRLRADLGQRRITQVSRADIRRFVNVLAAERKANTVRTYYGVLRAVYAFAISDLDIPVTFPALKSSELPDPADDRRERRILTDDELAAALDACHPHFRLYFRTLAETGARASEVLGLQRRRIGADTIVFAEQLGKDGTLAPLKSRNSRRTIEIRRALAAELRLQGTGRVFDPLVLRAVEQEWSDAIKRAAISEPRATVHDLRHTHASRLIAAGWDPVEVAKRLGDRVETILRTYVHEWDGKRRSIERQAAVEAMYGT